MLAWLSAWGADLHIAQQMPLPLTISCSSKSRLVLTFLVSVNHELLADGLEFTRSLSLCGYIMTSLLVVTICYSVCSWGSQYCDEHVCVWVCIIVREPISGMTHPNFTTFSAHVASGHSLILFCSVAVRYGWRPAFILWTQLRRFATTLLWTTLIFNKHCNKVFWHAYKP